MTIYEVESVIDKICEKLGTAKEVLVPELARMCSMRHLCNAVFCIIAFIIIGLIIGSCERIIENHENYDFYTVDNAEIAEIGRFVCCILMIGFFIALWYNVYECIQWLVAPTAKTFEHILQLL